MHQRSFEFSEPVGGGVHRNIKLKVKSEKLFEEIISLENLFLAWREFSSGKMRKADVLEFKFNLEDNLFRLHRQLREKTYRHFHYTAFNVYDPKLRRIHKAVVRDRVLHHAVFRILYPFFDKNFIYDSYSCRIGKGTHRAAVRLEKFCRKLSRNNTKNIFALKGDVRKFFDSVDQDILLGLIEKKIGDEDAVWLIGEIISSFENKDSIELFLNPRHAYRQAGFSENDKRGLPLGNVTSQLFANIYLNELDRFVKHKLKVKYYLRYCDDFIILTENENFLAPLAVKMGNFLDSQLKLRLHPDKIIIRKYNQGFDFLGYVVLPYCRVLRTKTKKRVLKKIKINSYKLANGLITEKLFNQSLQSYLGVLKHCFGHKILKQIREILIND